jgi:hypothetical protein
MGKNKDWPQGILSRVSREAYDAVNRARGVKTPAEREESALSYDRLFGIGPRKPRVVAVLEVMWGLPGDKPLRWFDINPHNHSGRRLNGIINPHTYCVTNACPDVVYAANQRGTPSHAWLRENLKRLKPSVILLCGNVAQKTFTASMAPDARVIRMPHPAARTWSKAKIAQARRKLASTLAQLS